MNKFKIVFALIAVFVILAAPAYSAVEPPESPGEQFEVAGCHRNLSEIPEQELAT